MFSDHQKGTGFSFVGANVVVVATFLSDPHPPTPVLLGGVKFSWNFSCHTCHVYSWH